MRSIREVCVKDHGEEEVRGWGNRPLEKRWVKPIQNDHVWVVELQNTICGFGYIAVFEEQEEMKGHIYGLYLTPEVLGKGFGYRLMDLMIQKARELKANTITLSSTITAHEFYKRLGFVDSGPMQRTEIGGSLVTGFPMIMNLEP